MLSSSSGGDGVGRGSRRRRQQQPLLQNGILGLHYKCALLFLTNGSSLCAELSSSLYSFCWTRSHVDPQKTLPLLLSELCKELCAKRKKFFPPRLLTLLIVLLVQLRPRNYTMRQRQLPHSQFPFPGFRYLGPLSVFRVADSVNASCLNFRASTPMCRTPC
jgi:hypothetical protein